MKKPFLIILLLAAAIFHSQAQEEGLFIKHADKGLYLDHAVASGQGLYSVGRLYNVSPKSIAAFNKIDLNKGLEIGQVIRIPLTDTNFTQKNNKGVPLYYTVGPSEGLLKVSSVNNKVTMQKLRDWNGLKSDALQVGQKLVVGYLVSKEMQALAASNSLPKTTPVKPEEKPVARTEPAEEKTVAKTQPVTTAQQPPVTPKEEPRKEEPKKEEPRKAEPVTRQETMPVNTAQGYFRSFYEQQVKQKPVSKNTTVTAGIFKTASGWEDAKFYLLIDGVATGTIVQLINPDNNKAIYAKVLGEMNGIRQNQGLGIRISNAGAAALGVADVEKFIVKMAY